MKLTEGLYHSVLCLFLILLNGCHDDYVSQNELTGNKPIIFSGEIEQVTISRVNDSGFCNGDVVGVYIVDYQGSNPGKLKESGNRANNIKLTFDEENNRWNSSHDMYWKDNETHIDAYGYYPYGNPLSVTEYAFDVQKNQAREASDGMLGGYEASDFLWAKATDVAPTTNLIRLSFRHRMSNARITLAEGTGFADGEWNGLDKQMLVLNTRQSSIINLNDGTVKSTGEVSVTGIIPARQGADFRAIVVPQTVPAFTPLFSIAVGGKTYKFTKEEAFIYISGKMHNFTIVVNKREETGDYEFILTNESINAWEDDLISHDATAREYIIIDVSEAGKLKESIIAVNKDYRKLQNLKLTGQINANDFFFMRDDMDNLQSLNLKEVIIKGFYFSNYYDWEDYTIPHNAFMDKKTLLRIVLPDKLNKIEDAAFLNCTNLTGSLIIPEGVTYIGSSAFELCRNLTGILSLPTTLERVGAYAFHYSGFTCELLLPSGLTHIGEGAFVDCHNLYGTLKLPESLTSLGSRAFRFCTSLSGSLEIPQSITVINDYTFDFYYHVDRERLSGTLTLHDGIISIGDGAFNFTGFRGELVLPKDLVIIGDYAFNQSQFSGELKLPPLLYSIGSNAFSYSSRLTGTLDIPENVQSIGSYAFTSCIGIEKVILPAALENIHSNAFLDCFGINSIVCKANIPPYVAPGAFDGIAKDNFILEVPEQVVQQYRTAPGWSDFKRISAYRELVCRPSVITASNTQSTHQLILNAESDWEVESIPEWCTLSATSGNRKTELTLTINSMGHGSSPRTGEVVFRLTNKDYTTCLSVMQYDYEYDEDQIITLQKASKGKGVNLVFLGDGFSAEEISRGEYMRIMREQVEHFFDIEPYTTYRDYFNVYTAIAVSPESGIETANTIRNNRFGTTFTGGTGFSANYDAIFDYALRMPTINEVNLYQSLVVITPNTTDYDGTCHLWEDGSAIAFCPVSTHGYPFDTRGIVQHEAGGHGFGKLGDENINHNAFIDYPGEEELRYYQSLGWYQNLSLTAKMHAVPWAHFIFHEKYANMVDIYEGGYKYSRGVFRSEPNSCMNNSIPYYSTISREAIVKRIMDYAGETYTFEKFLTNDKIDTGGTTRSAGRFEGQSPYGRQLAPRIHKGRPDILK